LRPIPPGTLSKLNGRLYPEPINAGKEFHFHHADVSPTNTKVSDSETVAGIIDWELPPSTLSMDLYQAPGELWLY
jgi:hypothetical protein